MYEKSRKEKRLVNLMLFNSMIIVVLLKPAKKSQKGEAALSCIFESLITLNELSVVNYSDTCKFYINLIVFEISTGAADNLVVNYTFEAEDPASKNDFLRKIKKCLMIQRYPCKSLGTIHSKF